MEKKIKTELLRVDTNRKTRTKSEPASIDFGYTANTDLLLGVIPLKLKPVEVLQAFVDAFNEADIDALMDLYDEGAVNHQVANEPVVGKTAIRAMFEREFATAEMVCIVENIYEDGQWAIMEWRDPLGLRGCGFFQVVKGKIVLQRGYWDKLSFLKQHNLPLA